VFGVTGYGNVSRGAQEILDLLPVAVVAPEDLGRTPAGGLVKTVFREEHLVEPVSSSVFDLQDYYDNPDRYRSTFARYLPHLSVIVNCIFWTPQYPRLVTKDQLVDLHRAGRPRLRVIGDISCDVEGSVEATVRATDPDDPVYVYDVRQGRAVPGLDGEGPVIMAVDNLPAELPREASETFSSALFPFIPALLRADLVGPLERSGLPQPLLRATVVHQGRLTPGYGYLQDHIECP
jgi:alpha-aminoadipic semialdehyde synthase